jgi:hypothetical protein
MIELFVPAIGLTGLLPKFVSTVDNLIFGRGFHILLSRWKHDPARRAGFSRSKAVQATLSIMAWQTNSIFWKLFQLGEPTLFQCRLISFFDENFVCVRLINTRIPSPITAARLAGAAHAA